jgi:hypothetical protein
LYQYNFKKNNQLSVDATDCSDDNNFYECTSTILFDDNLKTMLECVSVKDCKICNTLLTASFGFRSLITPVISVYINDELLKVPLNATISEISSSFPLPSLTHLKIQRLYNGGYISVRLKGHMRSFGLLPGDKINFH